MPKHFIICCVIFFVHSVYGMVYGQSEAILGQPLGVGCIVVPVSPNELSETRGVEDLQIYERNNRVLYPVFEVREVPREVTQALQNARRPIGRLVGEILDQSGTSIAVYFLFTGDQSPLNVTIVTNRSIQKTVVPVHQPVQHRRLMQEWWAKYNKDASPLAQTNDYPPVVKEYLRTMLAYRLGLQRPVVKPSIWNNLLYTELGFSLAPAASLFDAQTKRFFEPQRFSQGREYDLPPTLGDLIVGKQEGNGSPNQSLPLPAAGDVKSNQTQETAAGNAVSTANGVTGTDEANQSGGEKQSLWQTLTKSFSQATGRTTGGAPPGTDAQTPYEQEGIEPLAFHVPSHCFYVRFGSYSNFAWFQDTTSLWGGDMRNLIALRALKTRSGERLEQQIGLRQDALAKLFGDSVIDDVAVIGSDIFFEEGASFGLLFRAKNSTMLAADFNAKRRELLRQHQSVGAVETIVDVQGQNVSSITSPDHRIRTFYVAVGDYHLVTRSEQLARDFVALHVQNPSSAETQTQTLKLLSLGELPEFQQVREIMPVEEKATIFLYFPRPYFYNILSPAYWIETQRRATAAADIELLRLGGMAAAVEGHGRYTDIGRWLQLLRTGGYIPVNFGPLPDGSDTILASWKDIRNSQRGERGSFVPIADMLPTKVTEAEYLAYETMCRDFFENWGNLDPVVVSIKRVPSASSQGKMEHIVIDARMAPLSRNNRETLLKHVGPPLATKMAPVPGNFASFEFSSADNFFFGALRNEVPSAVPGEQSRPFQQLASEILSGIVLKDRQALIGDLLAGYLGYVGQPGVLLKTWDMVFLQRDDVNGYSRGPGGTWRRHFGPFTLYSRQRGILDQVSPQLGFVNTDYSAQLRIDIGNPLTARIAPTLNHLGWLRTCDTSRGNLRLLHDLQMQFHINGEECKEVAEQLLGGELICPLKGQYVYQSYGNTADMGRWRATALDTADHNAPGVAGRNAPFLAPPLNWFRGGKLDALLSDDAISIHAEFVMLLPDREP